jgi:hypothetical protein
MPTLVYFADLEKKKQDQYAIFPQGTDRAMHQNSF